MMDNFRVEPEALPRKFYRVNFNGTWSEYVPSTGFKAAGTNTTFQLATQVDRFWQSIRDQLKWNSGVRSPYSSLFNDRRHAENWALRWEDNNKQPYDVWEIDGTMLRDIYVFHPSTLQRQQPARALFRTEPSEYLCLHLIPETTFISRESTLDIKASKRHREEMAEHRQQRPGAHWVPELYSYYDTDNEYETNNGNDDMIKMMEGDC